MQKMLKWGKSGGISQICTKKANLHLFFFQRQTEVAQLQSGVLLRMKCVQNEILFDGIQVFLFLLSYTIQLFADSHNINKMF